MDRVWRLIPRLKATEAPVNKEVPCTVQGLRSLLDLLQLFAAADDEDRPWRGSGEASAELAEPDFVEAIRRVSELVVWGETHDPRLLDYFCERRALVMFVSLLDARSTPTAVKVQLLQTISVIVPNIKCASSLHYLFDGNHINGLITANLDFDDEEVLSWYISLLKTLALRLNRVTVRFFLDAQTGSFPLYEASVRFFCHNDLMVRSSVRCLTLSLFSFDGPEVQSFLMERAAPTFFRHSVAPALLTTWARLDALVKAEEAGRVCFSQLDMRGLTSVAVDSRQAPGYHTSKALSDALDEERELLDYIDDIHKSAVVPLQGLLAKCLLHCALLPLLGCLICSASPRAPNSGFPRLSPMLALHAISLIVRVLGAHPRIVEPLARALLWPSITEALRDAIVVPGSSIEAIEAACKVTEGSQVSLARWVASSEPSTVFVANPFRAALACLLRSDVSLDDEAPCAAVRLLLTELRSAPALPPSLLQGVGLGETQGTLTPTPAVTTAVLQEQTPGILAECREDRGTICSFETPSKPAQGDETWNVDMHQESDHNAALRSKSFLCVTPSSTNKSCNHFTEVVLLCVLAKGVSLATLDPMHRQVVLPTTSGTLQATLGRQHQHELFGRLVPDHTNLMGISRDHFHLSCETGGQILLTKLSGNPLFLNEVPIEQGRALPLPDGARLSFQCLADGTFFLTFAVRLVNSFVKQVPRLSESWSPFQKSLDMPDFTPPRSTVLELSLKAVAPAVVVLECSFAIGIDATQLQDEARCLRLDLRHRALIGRQHQPGFFENLLQGAPHFAGFISRAHVEVIAAGVSSPSCSVRPDAPSQCPVEVSNLSLNTIFIEGRPVTKSQWCTLSEGNMLTFAVASTVVETQQSGIDGTVNFLSFVMRCP